MSVLQNLQPQKVFKYFEEISAIPRGSGNMSAISDYCMEFARSHSLKAICDDAKNVIIFKDASKGYESSAPIILQGHLDMVCQKTEESSIDFKKDGISIILDGDTISADGTTLGADNGIAVAMVLAILDSDDIAHPPLEAVFTVDEEVGMLGAIALDCSVLKSKKMINLDSEEDDCMTVSCAGGSDFEAKMSAVRQKVSGTQVKITIKGLRGGHSGICIHQGRTNANILAGRLLHMLQKETSFEVISINGGDKKNAIPPLCDICLCVDNASSFTAAAKKAFDLIKDELYSRESTLSFDLQIQDSKDYEALTQSVKKQLIYSLVCTPNGVIDMSAEIEGLVETSLNLGVLKTENDNIVFGYALRSNKKTALAYLEKRMCAFFETFGTETSVSGQYPPWEFCKDSVLQKLYKDAYLKAVGKPLRVEAIHAGLECGVFADKIQGFDCIAIGPDAIDVHTVNEHLSASSVAKIFSLVKDVLAASK